MRRLVKLDHGSKGRVNMESPRIARLRIIRVLTFAHDGAAAGAAMFVGLAVRLGLEHVLQYWPYVLAYVAIASVVGYSVGLNSGIWRYASLSDLEAVVKTATAGILAFALIIFLANRLGEFPRSAMATTWGFTILFLAGSRVAYRVWRTRRLLHSGGRSNSKNALVIGAKDDTENFVKLAREGRVPGYRIVAIIDERGRRTGRSLRGVPVIESLENLDSAVARLAKNDIKVDCFILAGNRSIRGQSFDKVAKVAQERGISLVRMPHIGNLSQQNGSAERLALHPINLEDLIPRREVTLNRDVLDGLFEGTTILITGAGGSLGSELCRQVLRLKPSRLVLLDSSEYLLHEIDTALRAEGTKTAIVPLIGNVRAREQIFNVFEMYRPDTVFHCAALKHVPVVERQPLEGLKTNLLGTMNVSDAALATDTKAMVLISTDKAVRPTNVMGASKRIAEMYCQSLDQIGRTHFVTVRFGNVLGSTGSVVPLFAKQIAAGGPVTVTHPEIERYFMSIPEAVELVLHATWHGVSNDGGDRGRIFVLDMGAPVKIVEIARKMIWLKGLRPDEDVAIKFIGLRPGEKMFEELFQQSEQLIATGVNGVLAASPQRQYDHKALEEMLGRLRTAIIKSDPDEAKRILTKLIPEYVSSGTPQRVMTNPKADKTQLEPPLKIVSS